MEGYQRGQGRENGGKGTGSKKHKWYVQNRQEEVKNSIETVEAKELTCKTHEHELRGENAVGRAVKGKGE